MQWKQTHPNDYSLLNHFSVTRGFFFISLLHIIIIIIIVSVWLWNDKNCLSYWLTASTSEMRCMTMTFLVVCAVIKSRRELDFTATRPITHLWRHRNALFNDIKANKLFILFLIRNYKNFDIKSVSEVCQGSRILTFNVDEASRPSETNLSRHLKPLKWRLKFMRKIHGVKNQSRQALKVRSFKLKVGKCINAKFQFKLVKYSRDVLKTYFIHR